MKLYKQIEDVLLEEDEVQQLQQDQTWSIRDYGSAVWADSVVHEREQKIEEIEYIYNERVEAFIKKMDEWREQASKKYLNDIEFFKVHLHAYHMRVLDEERAQNAKKLSKTIKLPFRTLTFTKQQPEILINGKEVSKAKDDPNFVAFVKANNPEFLKEEVNWGDYKKTLKAQKIDGKLIYIDEKGQPLEFIQLIERSEKLDWKLNKEN
ncbi:host-nuclease inhibitor Gam family protein [Paenibacillus xylaniclasticus]|uniref:host-nuclease inhibitor Gam family protein n=1 Tax=Paenibacillus xylaniclasticus TaxID=588083 RepID=UPI000FD7C649|nr:MULTISPECIES: host-nuclease inhibitor Gam family protein [Paenibacillus]GFN32463.1 hypothetical protein PCURB6_27230 [Paenibacillus curdlanolyticus]